MSEFSITNQQGVLSKAPITQQTQDGIARGHALADTAATDHTNKISSKASEKVKKPDGSEHVGDQGKDEQNNAPDLEGQDADDMDDADQEETPTKPAVVDGHIDIEI